MLAGVKLRRSKDEQDVELSGQMAVASCEMVPRSIPKVVGGVAQLCFGSGFRAKQYDLLSFPPMT